MRRTTRLVNVLVILAAASLACNLPGTSPANPATGQAINPPVVTAVATAVVGPTDVLPTTLPDTPAPATDAPASVAPTSPPPAPGSGPTIATCPMFPADNIWNARVDTLPIDPNSDRYIESLGADTEVHPDFGAALWEGGPIGIPFDIVSGSQPKVGISFYYPDESDPGPYPIPPNAQIEGGPDSDGDRHILIVDQDNCVLYEVYDAHPNPDGSWESGSGAIFDLRSNDLRPDTWTSADAAGLPILPGLARYDEVAAGQINHALRFTSDAIRDEYVWPARHKAGCGDYDAGDTSVPPMGQRFRLKASFDVSTYPRDVQVILTALKQYGMILADCGTSWYITGAPDARWNDDELVTSLRGVTGSDFEAVDVSSLMADPDSGAVK